MPEQKTPSLAGGELLSKLTSLFETSDVHLDQAKKSVLMSQIELEKMKKEGKLENLAANLYLEFEKGFKTDLNENGKTGTAQEPYLAILKEAWQTQQMDKKSDEILSSPELSALDGFITNIENLPKMKEMIESAQPQAKWQTMLAGLTSNIPGLGENVNQYFGPILSMFGLDSWLPKPKDEAQKPEAQKADGKPDEKPEEKTAEDKDKKPDAPAEKKEAVHMPPEASTFWGDSNTAAMTSQAKDILKINGKIGSHAVSGKSAKWGRDEILKMSQQKPNPLKEYKNAVVLFGTNDLQAYKPEAIIGFLKEIYAKFKEAGVKVYAVTIPPVGGYGPYDKSTRAEETRTAVNDWILKKSGKEGLTYHIIDLAAKENKGGIANNDDPTKLCKNAHSGDGLHFDKRLMATIYQRELEIGTGKAAQPSVSPTNPEPIA